MVKNGPEQYTSNGAGQKTVTPRQLAGALQRCKGFIWGNAAYSVAFCVYRDVYHGEDNASNFERMLAGQGIAIPEGTINSAFHRNPWLKHHVDRWDGMGVIERALKLKDEIIMQVENIIIVAKETA